MDTETVRWLYAEAGRAGLAHLVVWGGEPLLRADLPELLDGGPPRRHGDDAHQQRVVHRASAGRSCAASSTSSS